MKHLLCNSWANVTPAALYGSQNMRKNAEENYPKPIYMYSIQYNAQLFFGLYCSGYSTE
jgi:hypothetical protein